MDGGLCKFSTPIVCFGWVLRMSDPDFAEPVAGLDSNNKNNVTVVLLIISELKAHNLPSNFNTQKRTVANLL